MKKLLLIAIALVASCHQSQDKKILTDYAESISSFSPDLVDHFPRNLSNKKISGIYVTSPSGAYAENMAYLFLDFYSDSVELEGLLKKVMENNIKGYYPNDTSLIVIGDTIDYSNQLSRVPVPSFLCIEKDFGLNSIRLSNDFLLFVLDAQSGEFVKVDYESRDKLPPQWKKGYSKGIAINKKKRNVIYWLVVW